MTGGGRSCSRRCRACSTASRPAACGRGRSRIGRKRARPSSRGDRVSSLLPFLKRAAFGARYALRMRRGRRAVVRHLGAPDRRPVPMPTFVQLRVTNLCNLRCRMCGQWGETGIYRADGAREASDGEAERERIRELVGLRRQMGLAEYGRLLDELAPHRPVISLFGGEPFLYPDVMGLVAEVKRRGLVLNVITNGWFLERHARELVTLGIDTIAVSIDGPPELHDRIRARPASFERAAAGIRAVACERERTGRGTPVLMAILPLTELNLTATAAAMDALQSLPLDLVNVGLRWFVPPAVGARYEAVMRESFGVPGDS